MTNIFPLNYFKTIFKPTKVFTGRKQLNWFELILIFLFLNALVMIPVTLNLAQMDSFPIEDQYPNVMDIVDEEAALAFKGAEFENGQMEITSSIDQVKEDGIIAGGVREERKQEILGKDNAIIFEENYITLKDEDMPVTEVVYTKDFTLENVKTAEDMQNAIENQWFIQNKAPLTASLSVMVFLVAFSSLLFIILGASFFVYLTKKGQLSTIETYKESLNLIANALGLPTLLAFLYGFFQFDIVIMLLIQSTGLIFMLLGVFYFTHFSDVYVEEKQV